MSGKQSVPWYGLAFSLRWRLALVHIVLLSAFLVILIIFFYNFTSTQITNYAQAAFQAHVQTLRSLLVHQICDIAPPPSLADFARQNTDADVAAIYLLDKNGKVLASSDGSLLHQALPTATPALLTKARSNVALPQRLAGSKSFHDGLLYAFRTPATCKAPQSLPAYIGVLNSHANEQNSISTLVLPLGIASALMILLGAGTISFFTVVMFKPLQQVTRATQALAAGDLHQRVPIVHSNDEISALAESFNQMADRIEQMFAAQQASEQRAQRFVSDASHELRTPITSLRGFTEVLIRGAKDDPDTAQRVLNLMRNEAERMTKLVNDLLTLARLDEGHFATPEDLDLVDIAVECLQEAKKRAPAQSKLALELATHERLKIRAAREPLKQMLLILLDNATKYGCTGEQKKVLLLLDKKINHALIQVIDYGVGISSEDLPHIFDRFYRGANAHSSTSTPIPGTGLGLPIAIAIAQVYKGSLTACSDPGHETIFTASFHCSQ